MENSTGGLEPSAHRFDSDQADEQQSALYLLLARLRSTLTRPVNNQAILQLHHLIEHQAALVRQAEAALASAEIFDRASTAARMGKWQCELPSEQLTWSNGTYDLFGLQRNCGLVRRDILKSYSEESLAHLQKVRSGAIEAGAGFNLDAEIHSPEFGNRWIRISATVERRTGEPVRLFGIKQDVTEEKKAFEHMRHLAEHDVMTGLANRTQFQVRLTDICGPGGSGGALMLIDLDGFKEINDTLGHALGDECLVEFTRCLSAVCQSADLIARIGGDEFAVLFGPSTDKQTIQRIAQRVADIAKALMNCSGRILNASASVGFALTEGDMPTVLFTRADSALYAAKAAGGGIFLEDISVTNPTTDHRRDRFRAVF
ncbi:MAG TPA: diguanylate cyclase [Shinella sp.]|jgi:diguanylate cyclase (GGDEF)-like protein|uniref:diguanylate cyclase domain-containing protein n=1 Tax=Shinella sp. TaxID=1870904 RepID=UPI0029AB2CF2|nr:diguanylate cyclase [Shinella sp.]MDX3978486.1 diguanylate cyclase [Shinella sp.]HEV7247582.1 diguanylate cyclase [Shinella sp.]